MQTSYRAELLSEQLRKQATKGTKKALKDYDLTSLLRHQHDLHISKSPERLLWQIDYEPEFDLNNYNASVNQEQFSTMAGNARKLFNLMKADKVDFCLSRKNGEYQLLCAPDKDLGIAGTMQSDYSYVEPESTCAREACNLLYRSEQSGTLCMHLPSITLAELYKRIGAHFDPQSHQPDEYLLAVAIGAFTNEIPYFMPECMLRLQ